ncbi:MAG: hypothetical protein COC06_04095 [Bacteroidales bacterium]|nr:MAG: hypothetical protein COC06_04095 [Bacteroidales bacterium]
MNYLFVFAEFFTSTFNSLEISPAASLMNWFSPARSSMFLSSSQKGFYFFPGMKKETKNH